MLPRAVTTCLLALMLATLPPAPSGAAEEPALKLEGKGGDWRLDLFLPAGDGPFPVAIFIPGCDGWDAWTRHSAFMHREALAAAGWGIAQLLLLVNGGVLSATACDKNDQVPALSAPAALAATEAAVLLAADSRVDAGRLVVLGQSFGANVGLELASPSRRAAAGIKTRLAAILAFYPWCEDSYGTEGTADFDTPVLVLIGELDAWAPVSRCLPLAEAQAARAGAPPFRIEVFPGSHHWFDYDRLPQMILRTGDPLSIIAGNPEQAARSRQVYLAWLADLLP
ncbi:MAG TPA: dienelactone hydrolase family protein [Kiloniellales bacterium]|nr:dienelactone hydrolase family protein [Kiloniellales bacterium]